MAVAVLLGSAVFGQPLSAVTLGAAVLLATTLVAGGVLARLDNLATERTLDDLVLKRTMTLGTREKWFRSLVQNSSDVVTVVDVDGVVRYQTPSVTNECSATTRSCWWERGSPGCSVPATVGGSRARWRRRPRTPGRPITLEFPIWHRESGQLVRHRDDGHLAGRRPRHPRRSS